MKKWLLLVLCVVCCLLGIRLISQSNTAYNLTSGAVPTQYMAGQTGSCGGGLILLNANVTCTATVTGVVAGQPCIAAPSDGTNMMVLGVEIRCDVTSSNTATVTLYAIVSLTPAAKTYNIRVYP